MKNWLTSSMASIPNSCRAVFGKSRWSSFLPKRALLNDHSAREILKRGFFEEFTVEQPGNASAPMPNAAWARNARRSNLVLMGKGVESVRRRHGAFDLWLRL